jgi:hypothetical protein
MILELVLGGVIFLTLALVLMPQWWSSSIGWEKQQEQPCDERSKPEP